MNSISINNLEFKRKDAIDAKDWISDLAFLRMIVFKDFPYLYEGDLEYEKSYLQRYFENPKAMIEGCFHQGKLVGATTATSLKDEDKLLVKPFLDKGYIPKEFCYFGESILLNEYRGLGVGSHFFETRLNFAQSDRDYKFACFCAVKRKLNDPRRPENYKPLDGLWMKQGFQPVAGLVGQISWQEIGEDEESLKDLQFWIKKL